MCVRERERKYFLDAYIKGSPIVACDHSTGIRSARTCIHTHTHAHRHTHALLPGSGHIDTAIWMHYMDANKTAGEETRWQLHKNAACNPEQVLAATPHKTPTVRTPAPYHEIIQVRRTRHAGHCWRSRDELIRDVLLWIPTHGRAKAGRPARTYIQQLCEDTGCCPEDLPRAMNDREEWRERVRDIRAASTIWWWWNNLLNNSTYCKEKKPKKNPQFEDKNIQWITV